MRKKISQVLKTQTIKDTFVMTLSTGISAVIAAIFFIIVARILGPENLGIFSLATAASFMFADIFDVALNASLIRFVARELSSDTDKSDKYLKFVFKLKLKISLLLIIVVTVLSKPLSRILFGANLPDIMVLVGFGTGFHLFLSFSISHLQARKQFVKAGMGMILAPVFRLLSLLGLMIVKSTHLISTLFFYFFSTPIAALLMLFIAPRKFLKISDEHLIAKKYLKYNIPLTVGFAIAAINGRVDNFILANLSTTSSVGFYSAAFRLFTPLQFFAGSLSTVFAPRFSSFANKEQAKTYLKKSLAVVVMLAVGLMLVFPFSPLIITLFFGSQFTPSIAAFRILLFGFSVFLIQAPLTSALLYYFSKPKIFSYISFFQLIILVSLDYLFIRAYDYVGAAFAFLITQIVMLVVLSVYVFKLMRED